MSPTSTQSSSCVPCGRSRRCGWTAEMVPAGSSTATVPGAPSGAEAEKTRDEVKWRVRVAIVRGARAAE